MYDHAMLPYLNSYQANEEVIYFYVIVFLFSSIECNSSRIMKYEKFNKRLC
jgi:hypothetical protein